ncbi:MAG: META domain-containing protein, partial [Microcystaceae cyanobacterium]
MIGDIFEKSLMIFSMAFTLKSLSSLLLLTSGLFLTGLTPFPPSNVGLSPVMAKPAPKMIASPLADTTWQLVGGEMLTANSNGQITLRFTQQNLSGSAGCNRYSTGYSVKDNQLKTKAIASTRMACPSPLMEQETAYLRALETAHSFKVNAQGELEIAYGDRAQPRTLRFVKVETQA